MWRAALTRVNRLSALVGLCSGVSTFFVLHSESRAVLPLLYLLMPGVAVGMFLPPPFVPLVGAVTNAVVYAGFAVLIRRVWLAWRGMEIGSGPTRARKI